MTAFLFSDLVRTLNEAAGELPRFNVPQPDIARKRAEQRCSELLAYIMLNPRRRFRTGFHSPDPRGDSQQPFAQHERDKGIVGERLEQALQCGF